MSEGLKQLMKEQVDQGIIETKLNLIAKMLSKGISLKELLEAVDWDMETYEAYKEEYGDDD